MERFKEVLKTISFAKSNVAHPFSNFLAENEIDDDRGMLFLQNAAITKMLYEVSYVMGCVFVVL